MNSIKWILVLSLVIAFATLLLAEENCGSCPAAGGCGAAPKSAKQVVSKEMVNIVTLSGYNKKVMLDKDTYFTYSFTSKVKMGANTLKVNVYTKDKKPVTSYQVAVSYDMPSMKGMHAQNNVPMQLNKKGNYLLPLNFVMPGVWQVDLQFMMDNKTKTKGSFTLKV
jgi:hypothetical protein